MLTIVIGSHMGSLTTPTIVSTFPQSSRFVFSFVIVGIRWRMEALNALNYNEDKDSRFTYWMALLSAVTVFAHCLVVLHDVLGEFKNFIKFTWDLVSGCIDFCKLHMFIWSYRNRTHFCEWYCSDWSSLEFYLNLNKKQFKRSID